ncbi:MAG: polyamine aminopropyltransferase [Deferribacteres bacterium]|nr:polyamine aminopropyltransferase [candidate division KSB1 bacterium]MCB9501829.1 polyamine aminopropyltransferase [Deferribacteres bacterium]
MVNAARNNFILKACIFATGLAGIVAEYVMSTLASYLLGNAVVQWALTISLMLFAMGLGSRLSKNIKKNLLDAFIFVELALSLLCAISAISIYWISIYIQSIDFIIYLFAIAIGLLIGMELPLATRLNAYFEELRINISSVMEKDYYGALLGGLLFAFVALPYLGLTYTPIILGTINLAVAAALFWQQRNNTVYRRFLSSGFLVLPFAFLSLVYLAKPIVQYSEQQKYRDTIIFSEQTPYQKIVITRWKSDYWLYLNGNLQFSTYDEARYHEPLVHPAFAMAAARKNILILGGGDGMAAREILKYKEVEHVDLVDIDPAVTALGRDNGIFLSANKGSLLSPKVQIHNMDAAIFVRDSEKFYDIVLIDLPDPKTVSLSRLYSQQFYQQVKHIMSRGGILVTQATSPFFSRKAYLSIMKTMGAAGFVTLPMHNNIPTMGEWGWIVGVNYEGISTEHIKQRLMHVTLDTLETRFINHDALLSMLHFGKGMFDDLDEIEINDEFNLVLYKYYEKGEWDYY